MLQERKPPQIEIGNYNMSINASFSSFLNKMGELYQSEKLYSLTKPDVTERLTTEVERGMNECDSRKGFAQYLADAITNRLTKKQPRSLTPAEKEKAAVLRLVRDTRRLNLNAAGVERIRIGTIKSLTNIEKQLLPGQTVRDRKFTNEELDTLVENCLPKPGDRVAA